MADKKKKSFTFIEVMLVTSMIFFVAAAIYGAVSGGMNIWKKADNLSRYEDVWVFFEKIRQDLRNTLLFSGIPFEGDSTYVVFSSVTNRPFRKSLAKDQPALALGQITWVKYEFDSRKNIIFKQEKDFFEYSGNKETVRQAVLSGVSSCKFEYYFYSRINKLTERQILEKGIVPDIIRVIVNIETEGRKESFSEFMEIPVT